MSEKGRVSPRIKVALKVFEVGAEEELGWLTRDLSMTGTFLYCDRRWPIGTTVPLRFEYEHGAWLTLAIVAHHDDEGVGFEFIDTDESSEPTLQLKYLIRYLVGEGATLFERRSNVRRHLPLTVVWMTSAMRVESPIRDLSATGSSIVSAESPDAGSIIYFYVPVNQFEASDELVVAVLGCRARVVHVTPESFGIEFVDPHPHFIRVVEQILAGKIRAQVDVPG